MQRHDAADPCPKEPGVRLRVVVGLSRPSHRPAKSGKPLHDQEDVPCHSCTTWVGNAATLVPPRKFSPISGGGGRRMEHVVACTTDGTIEEFEGFEMHDCGEAHLASHSAWLAGLFSISHLWMARQRHRAAPPATAKSSRTTPVQFCARAQHRMRRLGAP